MNLKTADSYAAKITEWLQPFCEKIALAGSIRRRRPECGDVDLVCIPKTTQEIDLLGNVISTKNLLLSELVRYVRATPTAYWSKACEPQPTATNLLLHLPKCQLDVWCASEANFATRLICRTGSKDHNVWIAQRTIRFGGHWDSYNHLRLGSQIILPKTETELYAALDLPFVEPENRETHFLRKFDR